MKTTETLVNWGLRFPNGDIIWDDVHSPRWGNEESRAAKTFEYGRMAVSMRQGIESVPIWVSRTVTVDLGLEVIEHDTRDQYAGNLFRSRTEGLAMAS